MNKLPMYCLGALLALLCGCAASTKDTIVLTQPVSDARAVISDAMGEDSPAADVDFGSLPRHLALRPFGNDTDESAAPEVIRRTLQNHLGTLNYQVMHWREVDLRVEDLPAPELDDPARLAAALGVDGIVGGRVTDYQFFYAGVYAQIKVGVELTLWDAAGEQLWQQEFSVTSRAGGVSTTAWGLLLNAALAAMHLNEKNLLAAADELGREVETAFPQPPGYRGMVGPRIESVIHDGGGGTLRYGDSLRVGLKGDSGQRASAVIAGIGSFDLPEEEPGVYIANIPISAQWNVHHAELSGRLADASGNVTRWVSPVGLISVDNTPPSAPGELEMQAHSGQVYLRWAVSPENDVANYRVYSRDESGRSLETQIAEPVATLPSAAEFQWLRYEVTAVDHVGNESAGSVVAGRSYPLPGVAEAEVAESRLGGVVTSSLLLSADNSPYTLSGALIVEDGAALYVEPGVVVRVSAEGAVTVRGEARFWGRDKGIRFEPQEPRSMPTQYLLLDSDRTVTLDGVEFTGGGIAVDIRRGRPVLKNVRIQSSGYSAIAISGTAAPSVSDCLIAGSHTSGVVVEGHARPEFHACRFSDNTPFHIQNSAVYEVNAEGNDWEPEASPSTILGDVRY